MPISGATAVVNAGLANSQATYYESQAVEALFATLGFRSLTSPATLPLNKGRVIELFTYDLSPFTTGVSAGSQPANASEGTPGTGLTPTSTPTTATLGQNVDYINCSDMVIDVAIDPLLKNLSKMLGYRASLIADTLAQMEFDAATALDASTKIVLGDGIYMTANAVRSAAGSLAGRNVRRFDDGFLHGVMHPFVSTDLFNDAAINGITDILKRSEKGQEILREGVGVGASHEVVEFGGVRFVLSTNVPLTANVPAAGKSAYSAYIAGLDAMFGVKLGGGSDLPGEKNFSAKINTFAPSSGDPAGTIAGGVAINFKSVYAPRPGSTMGFRRIQCESAIA
jgi:N4-gp56 family major capsid protein